MFGKYKLRRDIAIVNIIFGLKGAPGKNYNIQIRHSFPLDLHYSSKVGTLPREGLLSRICRAAAAKAGDHIIASQHRDDTDFQHRRDGFYATIA